MEVNKLSELADTHSTLYYKKFSITRGTKNVDNDGNRVRNYLKMARCNYIY